MNKKILSGVLAAQVVLAGALYFMQAAGSGSAAPAALVAAGDINKLTISDGTVTTTVEKNGEGWLVNKLPANNAKVSNLLESLGKLTVQYPVVNSSSGRERYEVADQKFQRHLTLANNDKTVADLYFGTSPGFRQTHVRRAGEDAVYAVTFNNFDLGSDSSEWIDRGLLKLSDFDRITGADFELVKNGDKWQLTATATPDAQALDDTKVATLVESVKNLQVLKPVDTLPAGENHSLSIAKGSESWVLKFTKVDSTYYVQRSDREQAFTLSSTDYERLGPVTRASLLQAPPPPQADAKAAPAKKK